MTAEELKALRHELGQAIARVYDCEHDYEDVRLLAGFAEIVVWNLSDKALIDALRERQRTAAQKAADARRRAEYFAAMVYKAYLELDPSATKTVALELAYWAYFAKYEEVTDAKKGDPIAISGPSASEIAAFIDALPARSGSLPAGREAVDCDSLARTVIPALKRWGFDVCATDAKAFL
jgi:hypothetical protein